MIPDQNRKSFEIKVGEETVTEADAVLCLLRLAENGDLAKVKLCEMCNRKWLFAAKKSYRFCGDECRESFYAKSATYHERKAANQRRYRENLKRQQAAQDHRLWEKR